MAIPLLAGVLGVAGMIGFVGAFSYIIQPLSIIAGGLTAFFTLLLLKNRYEVELFSREWMDDVIYVAVAAIVGYGVYRMFTAGVILLASLAVLALLALYLFGSVSAAVTTIVDAIDN